MELPQEHQYLRHEEAMMSTNVDINYNFNLCRPAYTDHDVKRLLLLRTVNHPLLRQCCVGTFICSKLVFSVCLHSSVRRHQSLSSILTGARGGIMFMSNATAGLYSQYHVPQPPDT
eukprot:scaffold130_cov185-Alexandrium_tamarense.AAC.21